LPDAPHTERDLPSGLRSLEAIQERLQSRRLALFLDFDGTLCPIAEQPDQAVLSPTLQQLLRRLAARSTAAVVSGRALADVQERVGLEEIVYAGSHGFEIRGPAKAVSREVGAELRPDLESLRDALRARLDPIPGAWVEDKKQTLAVHYRQTPSDRVREVEATLDEALGRFPRLRKHHGKKVFEVRPRVDWDKGRAVLWLLGALDLEGPDVLPVYLGDDTTDEDAFRALKGRGIGMLVAAEPRPSAADYRLRDTVEVRLFLEGLDATLRGGEA